jgi:purine-nucleoside phosphorylase
VPNFSSPTVPGHEGKILKVEGVSGKKRRALVLQGRSHYYEGYAPEQVVFPLRALALWGVRRFVITNASGALSPSLVPGDLAWIRDHLNFTGANPLRGPNLDALGPRFPSLAQASQNRFSREVLQSAARIGLKLKSGIYVGITGPSYETEAEIRAFRRLGGDMVGMSTVLEVIAAAHAGVELIALSAVSNSCVHVKRPVSHEEVLRNAKQADGKLGRLLMEILK